MAGGGTPGGLPLIFRFSVRLSTSVSLPLRAGTLILVTCRLYLQVVPQAMRYLPGEYFYIISLQGTSVLQDQTTIILDFEP
jgi:hypothetical protein